MDGITAVQGVYLRNSETRHFRVVIALVVAGPALYAICDGDSQPTHITDGWYLTREPFKG